MKYCIKCGTANDDQSKFCYACGTPFTQERQESGTGAKENAKPAESTYGNPNTGSGKAADSVRSAGAAIDGIKDFINKSEFRNMESDSKDIAGKLRKIITSRTYEVAMAAFALQIIISISSQTIFYSNSDNLINSIMYNSGLGYYVNSYGASGSSTFIPALIANSISILLVAGMWIQYSNAKDETKKTQANGFRIIRVLMIIQLVLLAIGCAVACIAPFIISSINGGYGGLAGAFFVIFLFAAAIMAFLFFYYYKIMKTVESAISVIETGTKTFPGSKMVTMVMYITVVVFAIYGIVSLIHGVFLEALEAFCGGTAMFSLGTLIGEFNELDAVSVASDVPSNREKPAYSVNNDRPSNSFSSDQDRPMKEGASVASVRTSDNSFNRADAYVKREANSANKAEVHENRISDHADRVTANADYSPSATSMKDSFLMEEATMLLDGDHMIPLAKLVRLKDQSAVRISKKQFTIGKATEGVDYCVDGNPAVSRRHAEIDYRDGGFYIIDTNSTNHVYVDDRMIPPGMPVRITDGTKIRLGNEMFQFSEG